MFPYSNTNKRYHTLNYAFQQQFGCKVVKIPLNGGFTCPNIDGTKGLGGCSYCSDLGSGDFGGNSEFTLRQQFEQGRKQLFNKWNDFKYVAYFQAHTNTYAPLSVLKPLFEEALTLDKDIVGLSIATRADCLEDDILDYLDDLNKRTFLTIELGLQTIHDETGKKINRCHSYDDFLKGFYQLYSRNIRICVHIINGLPGESKEMMLATAKTVGQLPIYGIKIHLLHVLRNTLIAKQLENHEFKLMGLDEYVSLVCDQLELLPAEIVIQRLTGDGDKQKLIGPLWSRNKRNVLNSIDTELTLRDSYQGKKL